MTVHFQKLHEAIGFTCQWPDLFRASRCNWIDFDFILLACEYDKIAAHFEIEAALLGFRMRICIPTPATEQSQRLAESAKAVKDGTATLVPLDEIKARLTAETGIEDIFVAQMPPGKGNDK